MCLYATLAMSACIIDWDRLDPDNDGRGGIGGNGGDGGDDVGCTPGETSPCYTGPEGTEGVGICASGTARCLADGSAFGDCEGETRPAAEDCDTPEDDDCDGEINQLAAGCTCEPGRLYSCYDGPDGTEGVGACAAGMALCTEQETLATCVAQITPQLEACHTAADDDCNGGANEACPTFSARFETTGGGLIVWDFELTNAGDIVVAGHLSNLASVDFGGGAITNTAPIGVSVPDAYVVKLDETAGHRWTWHLDHDGQSAVRGLDVDGNGNVYATGTFAGSADFGGAVGVLAAVATNAIFVTRLDAATGDAVWAVQLGDVGATGTGYGIATNDAGLSVFTGNFRGDITIGNNPTVGAGNLNGFVALVDQAGVITWGTTFGQSGSDRGDVAKFDADGNILIGGEFDESINFGGPPLTDIAARDGFVAKLSSSGAQQWIVGVGANANQVVRDIAVDADGNIIVFGENEGSLDVGVGVIPGNGGTDVFAAKIDPAGSVQWSRNWGGEEDQSCGGITTTAAGEIWLGISHENVADYGGGIPVLSAGDDDWVLVKIDGDGEHIRTHRYGDSSDQDPRALRIDANGDLVSVGDCTGMVDFGIGPVGSGSLEGVCIVKQPQ